MQYTSNTYSPQTRDLILGYDCPADALFIPAAVHTATGSSIREQAICVFERDIGKPLTRHTGYLLNEMGVRYPLSTSPCVQLALLTF